MIDHSKIKELIETRHPGHYQAGTEQTINDIEEMDPDIQRRALKFLEAGEIEDTEVEGYSIQKLMSEYGFVALGAFLMQNWLKKNPEKAKAALGRGFDSAAPRQPL